MRILVDECLSRTLVDKLRERGHDVKFMRDDVRGLSDRMVLALATGDNRLLISEDRDFGVLTFRNRQPSLGVIIVAVSSFRWPTSQLAQHVADILDELGDACLGHLTTIEPGRHRQRKFES
jgi:predicted nuclease of predicted toxin-antitoxin system